MLAGAGRALLALTSQWHPVIGSYMHVLSRQSR
jgi:hypothetical protein